MKKDSILRGLIKRIQANKGKAHWNGMKMLYVTCGPYESWMYEFSTGVAIVVIKITSSRVNYNSYKITRLSKNCYDGRGESELKGDRKEKKEIFELIRTKYNEINN
jgi:hypothetical protein